MKAKDIPELLGLEVVAGENGLERDVTGGYCGDLLSDVIANSDNGNVWITVQSHQNIVAVAVLRELSAVILVNGRLPDEDTKAKADDEGIPIFVSPSSAFRVSGQLHDAGIGTPEE